MTTTTTYVEGGGGVGDGDNNNTAKLSSMSTSIEDYANSTTLVQRNHRPQTLVKTGSRGLGNVYLIVPFIPLLLVKITVPIINIYRIECQ